MDCTNLQSLFQSLNYNTNTTNCCYMTGIQCTNGRISELRLQNKQMNGTIPSKINLDLTTLDLSGNPITGNIPVISSLVQLYLNMTSISGPIPPALGSTQLEYIYLQDTLINGTIPQELGNLNLIMLNLTNTSLTPGSAIPNSITQLSHFHDFAIGATSSIDFGKIWIISGVITLLILAIVGIGLVLFFFSKRGNPPPEDKDSVISGSTAVESLEIDL
ncbi:hypothetical protein HDV04_000717 [Boothiomyces sp. JEL0838]|nr:hypothetical protein HDV04_000717 [Boothiomyces sp. JEL0838]